MDLKNWSGLESSRYLARKLIEGCEEHIPSLPLVTLHAGGRETVLENDSEGQYVFYARPTKSQINGGA